MEGADRAVCVQIVKELLSCGADPNMLLTTGLGSALCVACDIIYESQRSLESRLALVSRGWGVALGREGRRGGPGGQGLGSALDPLALPVARRFAALHGLLLCVQDSMFQTLEKVQTILAFYSL